MSGIGPSELILLVVVGLLILGPERLPRVATQLGRWIGSARRTANQLRYQLEREITLSDIEGKKKEKEKEREKEKEQQADQSGEPPIPADTETHSATDGAAAVDDEHPAEPETKNTSSDEGTSSDEAKTG